MNNFEIAQLAIFAGMDDEDVEILLDVFTDLQDFEQAFDGVPEKLDEFIENCDKTIEAFNA